MTQEYQNIRTGTAVGVRDFDAVRGDSSVPSPGETSKMFLTLSG